MREKGDGNEKNFRHILRTHGNGNEYEGKGKGKGKAVNT